MNDSAGATIDWSPVEETAEPAGLQDVYDEYDLNPFEPDHREWALDVLALRHYTDRHVTQWASRIDALLDEFEPGWQDVPPVVEPVLESFELVHALVDDTRELDLSAMTVLLLATEDEHQPAPGGTDAGQVRESRRHPRRAAKPRRRRSEGTGRGLDVRARP